MPGVINNSLNNIESYEDFELQPNEQLCANTTTRTMTQSSDRMVVGNPNFIMPVADDIHLNQVILDPIRSEGSAINETGAEYYDDEKSEKNLMANFVESDDRFYPEGGLKAYLVVLGAFLGLIPVFGAFNMTSVIETYIQTNQLNNESTTSIGWIFSLFSFLTCFTSIFSGFIFDNYGCRHLMVTGTILYFVSFFLLGECTKIWHFILCYSIMNGFASGIMMSPLVSCSAHYFKRRRGHAISLATTGGSIGGVVLPLMLRPFFNRNEFKWGIRVVSFVSLALLIVSTMLLKERFYANDKFKLSKMIDFNGLKEYNYLFCVLGVLTGEMSFNSALTFYGSYCSYVGLSINDTTIQITIMNTLSTVGRYIPGLVSDSLGRYNCAIFCLISLTLVQYIAWLPFGKYGLNAMYAISCLYGLSSGSIYSLLPVCVGQISDTKDFGKRYSTMYFVVSFGILISSPISGAIIGDKSYFNYQMFIVFCGALSAVSAVLYYISRYASTKTWGWVVF
ncbi:hypothetical protein ACO0SA_001022 [Hanseniaspora valbyensis]